MFDQSPHRRRHLVAIASIVTAGALLLAGCASGSPSSGSSGASKNKNIIMIPGVSGNEGYDSVVCGAKEVAAQNHVTLTVEAANTFDPQSETPILQAAIAAHPAAILIAPTDATAMIAPIKEALAAGIKVILFDANLKSPSGTSAWVGVDNAAGGKLGGKTMASLINDKGKVMLVNFPRGTSTTDAREDGFVDALKAYSGISYLGPQYNSDPTVAASQVSASLTAHPDIAGVYATREDEGEGVVTGVRNSGLLGKVKIVSFDASPPEVQAVQQGNIQALIAQDVHAEGTTAMHVALDVLAGKKVKRNYYVGFFAITTANVNTAAAKAHYYVAGCKY